MRKYISAETVILMATSSVVLIFFCTIAYLNFSITGEQQFSFLAQSFLNGKAYFLNQPGTWNDTVPFEGQYYWPLSPFPAVVLMPFIFILDIFGSFFYIGYLQFFLVGGVFFFLYKISRRITYSVTDSIILALAFCCASSFLGVAACSWSWSFAQVVTVFLAFFILWEYAGKKRYWVFGLLVAMILATRVTAAGVLIFIVIDLVLISKKETPDKVKSFLILATPVFVTIVLIAIYNYSRFGSFLEQGYSLQTLSKPLTKARSYGMVDLVHLPGNLYYFLLSAPLPVQKDDISPVLAFPFLRANPWGMGLIFISPYFLYLFLLQYTDKVSKALLCTVTIIAIPVLLYYGVGYRQFGYRYSLDFLPLLFFLLIRNYRQLFDKLSKTFKIVVLVSSLMNIYLFMTLFFLNVMKNFSLF